MTLPPPKKNFICIIKPLQCLMNWQNLNRCCNKYILGCLFVYQTTEDSWTTGIQTRKYIMEGIGNYPNYPQTCCCFCDWEIKPNPLEHLYPNSIIDNETNYSLRKKSFWDIWNPQLAIVKFNKYLYQWKNSKCCYKFYWFETTAGISGLQNSAKNSELDETQCFIISGSYIPYIHI